MIIKSEYHDNFVSAQAAAGGLLDRAAQKQLFDRLEWHQQLHDQCLSDRKPLIINARAEAGERGVAAWLFLMNDGLLGHSALANWYNFTFRPIFGNAPDEVEKLALLAEIARKLSRKAHKVTIAPLPDEDEAASLTERAFRQAGWIVYREQCDENHVLHVRGRSFDDYWKERPGQLRSTVRRKSKKNEVQLRIETRFSEDSWADYETIYAKSWKPEEGSPDFLKSLAQRESETGCLRLGIAYLDGVPVASQFWTVENGIAYIHKLAHDEAAIKASPGTLLSAALFQHVIDVDQVELIDFGTGNDRYKADWMEEVRPRYRLELYWPHSPLSWPYIAKNWLAELVARHRSD